MKIQNSNINKTLKKERVVLDTSCTVSNNTVGRKANRRRRRAAGITESKPVTAPVSQSKVITTKQPPQPKTHRVVHREFIMSVFGSNLNFEVLKRLRLNPGSSITFPWLSTIAMNYERYTFHKLVFHYIPRCSTATSGAIMLSPDYDSEDMAVNNEVQASSNPDTREFSPWMEVRTNLPKNKLNGAYKSHFCMSDNRFDNTSQDAKTIDVGQLYLIALSGSGSLGKLWVEYDVELLIPQLNTETYNNAGLGTNKTQGLQATQQPFTNATFAAFNQPPISMASTDNINYPSSKIFQMLRDFKGFVDIGLEGTGLTGITDWSVSKITDGISTPLQTALSPMSNSTKARAQFYGDLSQGDFLSLDLQTLPTTLTSVVTNLGVSSVI